MAPSICALKNVKHMDLQFGEYTIDVDDLLVYEYFTVRTGQFFASFLGSQHALKELFIYMDGRV